MSESCSCEFAVRSLGKLHGIDMGKGRVRLTTHPDCPVHALCQHYTEHVRAAKKNGKRLYCAVHATKACPE